jgi:Protein of unknown function (DUF2950)
MMAALTSRRVCTLRWAIGVCCWAMVAGTAAHAAPQATTDAAPAATAPAQPAAAGETFDTPDQAAAAMIDAADKFDLAAFNRILGPRGVDVILTGDYGQDRKRAAEFAARAHEKHEISVDPKTHSRAYLLVGNQDWPFPLPLVKSAGKWSYDIEAGRKEIIARRIGGNELDAIAICRGYVEAQNDYAYRKRDGYNVNQYAQRIISSPGKQDGLAWQDSNGHWDGPIGEHIARAIAEGDAIQGEPYHGYFFKVLKGQGPDAPLGRMDFVVNGLMIGGFALVAAPAEYGETGIKTFIVSYSGVVYQKDLGPATLEKFKGMELYNPDRTWTRVED